MCVVLSHSVRGALSQQQIGKEYRSGKSEDERCFWFRRVSERLLPVREN